MPSSGSARCECSGYGHRRDTPFANRSPHSDSACKCREIPWTSKLFSFYWKLNKFLKIWKFQYFLLPTSMIWRRMVCSSVSISETLDYPLWICEKVNGLNREFKLDTFQIRPELCILCDAALWTTRIYTGASPGQHLMDIRYKDYPTNKVELKFRRFIGYLETARHAWPHDMWNIG